MFSRHGWDVRNSSIRVKDANQKRLDSGQVSDCTLERVLRRKITWAQCVIVVIGNSTHTSRWVQYEVEQAHKQGKTIVGVYARGCADAKLPDGLRRYATSIVSWNTDSIMRAVDGGIPTFQTPGGDALPPQSEFERQTC